MQLFFVCSYDGTVSTLGFSEGETPSDALKVISSTRASAPNPSWITVDQRNRILFCNSNDHHQGKGGLKSYSIEQDGSLTELGNISAPLGAAYHTLYNEGKSLAIPYYYFGVVGIYDVGDAAQIKENQIVTFPDFVAGTGRSQEQPRPHQTVVDPTGRYLLVPDLGADRIRVFNISNEPELPHQIEEIEGLDIKSSSFPRHVVFALIRNKTMMYILNQDICTLLTYSVKYLSGGGLSFLNEGVEIDLMKRGERVVQKPVLPPEEHGVTASHLAISPDKKFLIISIRKDRAFEIKSPLDPDVTVPADSIVSYTIDQNTGALYFAHDSHSGGLIPRHFSLNRRGDRIAITQQHNGMLSIYERDVRMGQIGRLLAFKDGFGENGPACVKWYNPEQI